MRAEIREIPNGIYRGESSAVFDTKHGREECTIRVTIAVKDEEIELDYSGTDQQNIRYTNAPFASSWSAAVMSLLMLVDPAIPHNDGIVRPIKVKDSRRHVSEPEVSRRDVLRQLLERPQFRSDHEGDVRRSSGARFGSLESPAGRAGHWDQSGNAAVVPRHPVPRPERRKRRCSWHGRI